jgi:hypothetical protein
MAGGRPSEYTPETANEICERLAKGESLRRITGPDRDDDMPETANIYGLTCPTTGDVRYIGKAACVKRRYRAHMRETRRRTPVYDWIAALRGYGLTPGCVVLAEGVSDWREVERRLIAEARARGDRLLNLADGGDEPHCPKEVRAKNGRATARAVHSDPFRRRAWECKRAIGAALRDGFCSNAMRAKLRMAAAKSPSLFGCYANLPDRKEAV